MLDAAPLLMLSFDAAEVPAHLRSTPAVAASMICRLLRVCVIRCRATATWRRAPIFRRARRINIYHFLLPADDASRMSFLITIYFSRRAFRLSPTAAFTDNAHHVAAAAMVCRH